MQTAWLQYFESTQLNVMATEWITPSASFCSLRIIIIIYIITLIPIFMFDRAALEWYLEPEVFTLNNALRSNKLNGLLLLKSASP